MKLEKNMKNVLKTTLVAAAVAGAFSVNAATVNVAPGNQYKLSQEGLALGLTTNANPVVFDVIVAKDHPAGSKINLTFPTAAVSLAGINAGACSAGGGSQSNTITCGDIEFNVGNGNFTFDNLSVNAQTGVISFYVNLGSPILANSAFRVTVGGVNPTVKDAFSVSYDSELAGNAIDSGSGVVATAHEQFTGTVVKKYANTIERVSRLNFVYFAQGTTATTDTLSFYVANDTTLAAAATYQDFKVTLGGSFARKTSTAANAPSVYDGDFELVDAASNTGAANIIATPFNKVTFVTTAIAAPTAPQAPANPRYAIEFTNNGPHVLDPQSFDLTVDVEYNAGAGANVAKTVINKADAGQWRLNASVVNVPYLPVNHGLSPNVEVANQGNTDAEITLEAIDNVTGEKYGPVNLVHRNTGEKILAKKESVTTVTEADIVKSFGIENARKLSVTFVIDANEDVITLSPYYRQNESRINVLTDQYKK